MISDVRRLPLLCVKTFLTVGVDPEKALRVCLTIIPRGFKALGTGRASSGAGQHIEIRSHENGGRIPVYSDLVGVCRRRFVQIEFGRGRLRAQSFPRRGIRKELIGPA